MDGRRRPDPYFFHSEGSLAPDSPSYVEREADAKLLGALMHQQFSVMLASRKVGKSSLIECTFTRLRKHGVLVAMKELVEGGAEVTEDGWYSGLAEELVDDALRRNGFVVEPGWRKWWDGKASIPPGQRFTGFLRTFLLEPSTQQWVIALDEIDTMIPLGFSDDFFAAVRRCQNARAADPVFRRLTFFLTGVASPAQLIKDNRRPPFNIGRALTLTDFSAQEATVFLRGLGEVEDVGHPALGRVLHWTGGHPYLTQRVFVAVAEALEHWHDAMGLTAMAAETVSPELGAVSGQPRVGGAVAPQPNWTDLVDDAVWATFLKPGARSTEPHFHDIDKRRVGCLLGEHKRQVLTAYLDALHGNGVRDDMLAAHIVELKLCGLLFYARGDASLLEVRNRIYRTVFNEAWVREQLPRTPVWADAVGAAQNVNKKDCANNVGIGTKTINWLHLSDIQINTKQHSRNELLAYLAESFVTDPETRPDLIFCTGDIAYGETNTSTLVDQYKQAEEFFSELLNVCGKNGVPMAKERLFVVPGNHDVNRKNINSDAQAMLVLKAGEPDSHVAEINQRFDDCKNIEFLQAHERLREYQKFVETYLPHQHDVDGRGRYSALLDVNGVLVGVGGMNSAWSSGTDPKDRRRLWLAAEWQFNKTKADLNGAILRIGMMHHPVANLNENERDFTTRRIAGDFDFFLHGHSRNAWVVAGSCITVAAGAACNDGKDEFGVNLVQLNLSAGTCRVHFHRYDGYGWTIAPISHHAPKGIWKVELPDSIKSKMAKSRLEEWINIEMPGMNELAAFTNASVVDKHKKIVVPSVGGANLLKYSPTQPDIGPMELGSPLYVERNADRVALGHFLNNSITVALRGAPASGRSSLAIRLQAMLAYDGWRTVTVNLGKGFAADDYRDDRSLFWRLAEQIVEQTAAPTAALDIFQRESAPSAFNAFLFRLWPQDRPQRLLLTLDRIDALADTPCCAAVLSGLRVLHNEQNKMGGKHHVKMLLLHTIRPQQDDPTGSVFDVARQVDVDDFGRDALAALVALHGLPPVDVPRLHEMLGGHPLLSRMALNAMAEEGLALEDLLSEAALRDGGIFKMHLQHVQNQFKAKPDRGRAAANGFRTLLAGGELPDDACFEALLGLGVVRGSYSGDAVVRCGLYASWLPPRLAR